MTEYKIGGKKIELDTDKMYMDFFWEDNQPTLINLNLEGLLEDVQSGELPLDAYLIKQMEYFKRWILDAPRKRALREFRRKGIPVITTDALFEQDGGDKIIDNLENTGLFAAYFLSELYGN